MKLARIRTPDGIFTGEYDGGEPSDVRQTSSVERSEARPEGAWFETPKASRHHERRDAPLERPRNSERRSREQSESDGGVVETDDETYALDESELLAPCEPSALYCVGRNFAATLDQMDYERPERPDFFIKPPVSVHPPEREIPYPNFTTELTYAGELAAVIDNSCTDLAPEEVPDVVCGYTILNDLDALDQDGRTARKAFDGSAPLGPWIETDADPENMEMETRINGEVRQETNTAQMLFSPREVISFLSERFTFRPDDVISFGSPANPGLLEPGDEIEITYEGIGTLKNTVGERVGDPA